MSYYESDFDDAYYDDDYDDVLVEDYDDDIDEDYEDAIVEDLEEAPRRRGARRKPSGRRRLFGDRRRKKRNIKHRPKPAVVKPEKIERAFNKVDLDVKKLKESSNIAGETALIQALSIIVNNAALITTDQKVLVFDNDGKTPKEIQIKVATGIEDRIPAQLAILFAMYLSSTGKVSRLAPYLVLSLVALFPNLLSSLNLSGDPATKPANVENKPRFDAKSMLVLGVTVFAFLNQQKRRAA